MPSTTPFILSMITSLILSTGQVSAQSRNTSSYSECTYGFYAIVNGDFNSSGTIPINFEGQDPWYLSMAFQERRSKDGMPPSEQNIHALLSLPESYIENPPGNETKLCSYLMFGQNATSEDGNNATESCSGVLSKECRQALQNIPGPSNEDCPGPGQEVKDACGDLVRARTLHSFNFTSPACALDGVSNIDLPDEYKTYAIIGSGLGSDDQWDTYESYDMHIQQSFPIVLRVSGQDQGSIPQPICITPNNYVDGTRIPETKSKDSKNAASTASMNMVVMLFVAISCIFEIVLA